MKIEHLIVQHLYNSKKVTLEDIGTFFLSPNVHINTDDKEAALPENAITFEFQPKAPRDESLVDFIVQHSHKIKPLATSDLESYSILGREYLNIGKPFLIEGLGTLEKTQFGTYEFLQGTTVNPKLEAQAAHLKEKEDAKIDFSSPSRKTSGNTTGILIISLVVIAFAAAAVVYFLNRNKKEPLTEIQESGKDTQVLITNPVVIDSSKPDSGKNLIQMVSDSTFSVILRTYAVKDAAERALTRFKTFGHNVVLIQQETNYLLSFPIKRPLSDTTKVKDSLIQKLGGHAYIILNPL